MANSINVTVVEGSDSLFTISALMNGAPLPFNDFPSLVPYVQVKSAANVPDSQAPSTLYTVGSGLIVTDATSGEFTWALPNSATYGGNLWYRAYVVNSVPSTPLVYVFLTGMITVTSA